MKYYRFKTFTTAYYFPSLKKSQQYMYGLYSAYGGRMSKAYWWMFRHCSIVRALTSMDEKHLDFPYNEIKTADGGNTLMAFNMGSPGLEQKISILGYDNEKQKPFFAKFSQKPQAMQLTRNEVKVYEVLDGTGLTPQLLGVEDTAKHVYLKAEYIKGKRPKERRLTDEVLRLSISLKNFHLTEQTENADGLRMSLSHGDFCPWNVLVDGDHWRLIDWECAADRTLGYDLLTYICQVSILFEPERPLQQVVEEHREALQRYFSDSDITDYQPYLRSFAEQKWKYEEDKENMLLAEKYKDLYKYSSL